jgi:hypothetical protein
MTLEIYQLKEIKPSEKGKETIFTASTIEDGENVDKLLNLKTDYFIKYEQKGQWGKKLPIKHGINLHVFDVDHNGEPSAIFLDDKRCIYLRSARVSTSLGIHSAQAVVDLADIDGDVTLFDML